MGRRRQREVWEALGRNDGDWAVLTERERRGGGWANDLDRFYATGRAEVEQCLSMAAPQAFTKALDFGAGTGRLSLALAERFSSVTSVDVSASMLQTLSERAAGRGLSNVTPVQADDFRPAGDHDFAISLLVLQHLPSRRAVTDAVASISASLRPGGVAVLEVPERVRLLRARLQPRWRVYTVGRALGVSPDYLRRRGFSGISMLTIDERAAMSMFQSSSLVVVDRIAHSERNYDYVRWVVRRAG